MRTIFLMLALICLVATASVGQATIYKWVDENGTITFRDSPPPHGTETTVVTPQPLSNIEYDSGLTPAEDTPVDAKSESPGKKSTAKRTSNNSFPEVDLYVTSWCGYCTKAKAYLRSNGVPFKLYDVEKNSRASKRHIEINPSGGVPVAVIGGQTIRGFSPDIYGQALGL